MIKFLNCNWFYVMQYGPEIRYYVYFFSHRNLNISVKGGRKSLKIPIFPFLNFSFLFVLCSSFSNYEEDVYAKAQTVLNQVHEYTASNQLHINLIKSL